MATKFRAIKAKAPNVAAARFVLLNEMRKVGGDIKDDFEAVTSSWKHKPTFDLKNSLAGGQPSVTVSTTDKIFGYVDEGTKPHIIRPKRAKILHFSVGGAEVFTSIVHHPGTKAQKHSERIARKWRGEFGKRMVQAMKRAADATGHGKQ